MNSVPFLDFCRLSGYRPPVSLLKSRWRDLFVLTAQFWTPWLAQKSQNMVPSAGRSALARGCAGAKQREGLPHVFAKKCFHTLVWSSRSLHPAAAIWYYWSCFILLHSSIQIPFYVGTFWPVHSPFRLVRNFWKSSPALQQACWPFHLMFYLGLKRWSIYTTDERLKAVNCVGFWSDPLPVLSAVSLQSDNETICNRSSDWAPHITVNLPCSYVSGTMLLHVLWDGIVSLAKAVR